MILVDIYMPAIDDSYDFMLDENTAIDKIILEISEMMAKKMGSGKIDHVENFFLYLMNEKRLLEREKTLYTCGVRDGSRLMLV